jgi:antitoxin (DNA-binding transcriptional repressor) of toxin-antitoxin stability system
MTAVSITEAKNNLSKLLKKVKHGESVLILDRKVPVACLEPLPRGSRKPKRRIGQNGAAWPVRPPRRKLPKDFWTLPRPKTRDGSSVLQALLDERAESR